MNLNDIINFLELEIPESRDNISAAVTILYDEIGIVKEKIAEKLPELAMNNEIARVSEHTEMINHINTLALEMKKIFPELEKEVERDFSTKYHYLSENLEYTRPSIFVIEGKEYPVVNWTDLFIKTCQFLYEKDKNLFMECIKNESFILLTTQKEEVSRPRLIEGTGIYFDRVISVKKISNTLLFFFEKYRIPVKSYRIYIGREYEKGKRNKTRCIGYDADTEKCMENSSAYCNSKCLGSGRCQWYKEK